MYINATKEVGLRFVRGSGLRFSVFADADYAAVSNDCRSVSGVPVIVGDTSIRRKSSTQECVTTETCEAEYFALCDTAKEAICLIFLQPQLAGMCIDISGGNEGAMAIASNRSSESRSKHIDVMFTLFKDLCVRDVFGSFMYERKINTRILLRRHYSVRSSWCTAQHR